MACAFTAAWLWEQQALPHQAQPLRHSLDNLILLCCYVQLGDREITKLEDSPAGVQVHVGMSDVVRTALLRGPNHDAGAVWLWELCVWVGLDQQPVQATCQLPCHNCNIGRVPLI